MKHQQQQTALLCEYFLVVQLLGKFLVHHLMVDA
jgi:hypothetical protein